MKLNYSNYIFKLKLKQKIEEALYLDSSIRGLLGHKLKRISCPFPVSNCDNCLLRENCKYIEIFESSQKAHDQRYIKGSNSAPHPFFFNTRKVDANFLDIELTLLGEPRSYLPYFILAIEKMSEEGIGKDKWKFDLDKVLHVDKDQHFEVYSIQQKNIVPHNHGTLEVSTENHSNHLTCLEIELLSPLRIKKNGKLLDRFSAAVFFAAVIRRIDELFRCYGEHNGMIDYKELLKYGDEAEIENQDLIWVDYRRYSNRQKSNMKLGGVVGSFTLTGNVKAMLPYLRLAEILHVGKATSFGFGKIRIKKGKENLGIRQKTA